MEVAILFAVVVGLMLIGVPIAVSLGMASILFLLALGDTSLASIAQTFFQAMAGHYTLLAIPFFILASGFMSTGGVARRIQLIVKIRSSTRRRLGIVAPVEERHRRHLYSLGWQANPAMLAGS